MNSDQKLGPFVAIFPGQGSQTPGMGKSLYENFATAKRLFEEASDYSKLNLKKLCFDSDEKTLNLTENTQPALLTVSVAAFTVAQEETGFSPVAVAGHSLGEYSALVANGGIPLAKAIIMVRERGLAMQSAVPVGVGGMTAILGLSDETVLALTEKATKDSGEIVVPANFNAPSQVVISGTIKALEKAEELLKNDETFKGGKAIRLPVSAPFHSPHMRAATERMQAVFSELGFVAAPSLLYPIIPNATARLHQEPTAVKDLLLTQMESPVLWKQTVEAFQKKGFTQFVEFGSGKVLQGLCKRISKDLTSFGVADLLSLKSFSESLSKMSEVLKNGTPEVAR